jgi:hypothetical protein
MTIDERRFDAVATVLATNGSRRQAFRAIIEGAATSAPCGLADPSAIVFSDDFARDDLTLLWDDVQGLVVRPG